MSANSDCEPELSWRGVPAPVGEALGWIRFPAPAPTTAPTLSHPRSHRPSPRPAPPRRRVITSLATSPLRPNGYGSSTSAPALAVPQTNGKAERFIQSLQREWAYVAVYETSHHRA